MTPGSFTFPMGDNATRNRDRKMTKLYNNVFFDLSGQGIRIGRLVSQIVFILTEVLKSFFMKRLILYSCRYSK